MDAEVLREKVVSGARRIAGLWRLSAEERQLAQAQGAFWSRAPRAYLDELNGFMLRGEGEGEMARKGDSVATVLEQCQQKFEEIRQSLNAGPPEGVSAVDWFTLLRQGWQILRDIIDRFMTPLMQQQTQSAKGTPREHHCCAKEMACKLLCSQLDVMQQTFTLHEELCCAEEEAKAGPS